MPDSFFVTRLLPVLLTSYQSSGVIMAAALVEFWFQCLDFPPFEWRHHASLIFGNWVVSSGLTSYGLSGAVIPSSCLELDCFQWCDFMLVEWHCLAILIFFENLIASASGDWTSYGLSGAIMTSSFWNLIAYSDYDFLHFEWRHHAYLIFLELHCFRCFDFLQF